MPTQPSANSFELNAVVRVAREAFACRAEPKVQRTGKVGTQLAGVDASGISCNGPTLPWRPHDVAGNTRLSIQGLHLRAAHDEPILGELRLHSHRRGCEAPHRDDSTAGKIVGPPAREGV